MKSNWHLIKSLKSIKIPGNPIKIKLKAHRKSTEIRMEFLDWKPNEIWVKRTEIYWNSTGIRQTHES